MIKIDGRENSLKKVGQKGKSIPTEVKEPPRKQNQLFKCHTIQNLNSHFPSEQSESHGSLAQHSHQMRKSETNLAKKSASCFNRSIKNRINTPIKSSISTSKLQNHKVSSNVKFSKINDQGLHTIKIESNENQQLSSYSTRPISSVKRSSKFHQSMRQKKNSHKDSHYNNNFAEIATRSEIYEDFRKQLESSQKKKKKETPNEKQNLLQSKEDSYYQTQKDQKIVSNYLTCVKQSQIPTEIEQVKQQQSSEVSMTNKETKENSLSDYSKQRVYKDEKIENRPQQKEIISNILSDNPQHPQKSKEFEQTQKPRVLPKKVIEDAEELFRNLSRELASKRQILMFERKFQNFYQDLRLKMMKKYDLMMKDYRLDDKQRVKIQMLIEGCNLEKHRRIDRFKFERNKTQIPPRPETAKAEGQASKEIYNLNHIQKKKGPLNIRPLSSHQKPTKENYFTRSFDHSSWKMIDCLPNSVKFRKQRQYQHSQIGHEKSQFGTFFSLKHPNFNNLSSRNQKLNSSMRKSKLKQKLVKQRQFLSKKFSFLIEACEGQTTQHKQTKKKMQVFEYYCSKVENGFQKISKQIHDQVMRL